MYVSPHQAFSYSSIKWTWGKRFGESFSLAPVYAHLSLKACKCDPNREFKMLSWENGEMAPLRKGLSHEHGDLSYSPGIHVKSVHL